MLLTMLVVFVMTGAIGGDARGQSLEEVWDAPHVGDPFEIHKESEGVALVSWVDGSTPYVFVTGWATNSYGGVCVVTYKLFAADGSVAAGPVFFPPVLPESEERKHKPTAITVDHITGDVYVAGYSQNLEGDYDYILLKYDGSLESTLIATGWAAISPDPPSVRRFNGVGEGDDKAVDVVLAACGSAGIVAITGTSRGATNNDIVTIAYSRTDGDLEWLDSYDGPGEGNDLAVAMAVVTPTVPSSEPATSIIVAGTTYGGSTVGFDMVALRYDPCDFEDPLMWAATFNNDLANGDDICTALAVIDNAVGTQTGIFLIGSTPHHVPSPGDTDYITFAIRMTGVLSNDWATTGFGVGVRVWDPGQGTSDDSPTAVTIAGSSLVITGRVQSSEDEGAPYDIGTIAYEISDGDVIDALIFGEAGEGGVDVRATAIETGYSSDIVYIAGWYYSPSDDGPYFYLTLKLTINAMSIDAVAYLWGHGDEAKARDLIVLHGVAVGDKGLVVTGRLGIPDSGLDIVSVKYSH